MESNSVEKNIFSRDNQIIFNHSSAGAGTLGLVIIVLCLAIAIFFNEIQLYGWMMSVVALGFLSFNVDFQFRDFINACLNVVVKSRHINDLSHEIIECNKVLDQYEKTYLADGNTDRSIINNNEMAHYIVESNLEAEKLINVFENRIVNDTDESYAICISVLEGVGNLMPLAGLVGTVYGIIITLSQMTNSSSVSEITSNISVAMQTTLYGAAYAILFKVISSRFKLKRDALEYDFERLSNHIIFWSEKR